MPDERGEYWSVEYDGWGYIHQALEKWVTNPEARSHQDLRELVYLIGCDEDMNYVMSRLVSHPAAFSAIAAAAVKTDNSIAKAVVAGHLGQSHLPCIDAEKFALILALDNDDEVKRRAMHALGRLKSPHAEEMAIRAWATGDENWKRTALFVLKDIGSSAFQPYCAIAQNGSSELLRRVADHLVN